MFQCWAFHCSFTVIFSGTAWPQYCMSLRKGQFIIWLFYLLASSHVPKKMTDLSSRLAHFALQKVKSYLMRSRTWFRMSLFIFKFKLSSSGMILQPDNMHNYCLGINNMQKGPALSKLFWFSPILVTYSPHHCLLDLEWDFSSRKTFFNFRLHNLTVNKC